MRLRAGAQEGVRAVMLLSVPATMGRSNVYTLQSAGSECARCGTTFEPRETDGRPQRFCSPPCRIAYHKARYAREPHRCPLCGREHEPERLANFGHSAILIEIGGGIVPPINV